MQVVFENANCLDEGALSVGALGSVRTQYLFFIHRIAISRIVKLSESFFDLHFHCLLHVVVESRRDMPYQHPCGAHYSKTFSHGLFS